MRLLMLLLSCLGNWRIVSAESFDQDLILRAASGQNAALPCGQEPLYLDGPNSFVIWTKDNETTLYEYPNENTLKTPGLGYLEQVFGSPCETGSCRDPTSLKIKNVRESDAGVYRCRVHCQGSSGVDFYVQLKVVDSPGTPIIYKGDGTKIHGHAISLTLWEDMTLVCKVDNGQPKTLLWWERNGKVMERTETIQRGELSVTIQVRDATRDELDAHYVCLVQNADITDPLSASVVVKMHLPPLFVDVRVNNNLNFEAGQPRVVDCVVVGCVPSPTVTWHIGDRMLRPSVHKELHEGNYTVSSLTLVPSLRDDNKVLRCRAQNPYLPGLVFENSINLNVGFRPTSADDHKKIIGYIDGQPESVSCTVEAYPDPLQFSWTFPDTKTLYTDVEKVAGYEHRFTSSLTWNPHDSDQGDLLCRASNILGEQKNPCVYSVVTGGPPKTPECDFTETDPETYRISCKKSWDGGRPQTIHLELQNASGATLSNLTDKSGLFSLQNHKKNLTAIIYSSNSRGRSESRVLALTLKNPTPTNSSTVKTKNQSMGGDNIRALVCLVVVTVVIMTVMGLCAYCLRSLEQQRMRRAQQENYSVRSEGSYHREPELQLIKVEGDRHAIVTVRPCDIPECQAPRPSLSKPGKLLGYGDSPPDAYYV